MSNRHGESQVAELWNSHNVFHHRKFFKAFFFFFLCLINFNREEINASKGRS